MSFLNFRIKPIDINEGFSVFQSTPEAVLVDVRTPEEFAEGHIPGSINLPLNRIPTILAEEDTPLFVYCYSGARSRRARVWLERNGYIATDIGGIMNYRGEIE